MKLLPLMILLALPAEVPAQYTYTTNNSMITIIGYTGSAFAIEIPSMINGLPVTSIGSIASHSTSLAVVLIPNSITNIGDYAFYGCLRLTTITVDAANPVYSSLDGVLFNKTKTTLIRFPGGKPNSYTIPNTVTSIVGQAFSRCDLLTSVTIPSSVTTLGVAAFSGCLSLPNVTIPSSLTNIGDHAFFDCLGLTTITADAANPVYSSLDGVLFNKTKTTLIQFPGGKVGSYTIPTSVTNIWDSAFKFCKSLTSVTIPNSVTSIDQWAFSDCTSLISVTMGDSVNSLGLGSFSGCLNLTNINIPDSVTSIGGEAFAFCANLTSITIPNSVTSIGEMTFQYCSNLASITIGNKVTSIGAGAFYDCTRLTSVVIPDSVTNIEDRVFVSCSKLTNIMIGNRVVNIGYMAFSDCTSLTNVNIPNSVTSLGDNAFHGCFRLTGVYFQGNAPSIGSDVFSDDNNAIVYYMPGTTGWATTFGGRPSVLINPSLEIKVKTVQITMHVATGKKYQLEASLDCKTWSIVGQPFVAASSEIIQDFDAGLVGRYFRLSEVP
jgi:hypothetical protein